MSDNLEASAASGVTAPTAVVCPWEEETERVTEPVAVSVSVCPWDDDEQVASTSRQNLK